MPYWNLYLEKHLSFNAQQIGIISAIVLGTKLFGPYFWGLLADRFGRRMQIIRLGSFCAWFCFAGILWWQDFPRMALLVTAYSFFWNAVLAQFEVVSLSHLHGQTERYSLIRLWGSVGFIVAVLGIGALLDILPVAFLPYVLLLQLSGIWLASLTVAEKANTKAKAISFKASAKIFWQHLHKRALWVFFIVCFLVQFSHGPYYTFFSIYLDKLNYSNTAIGLLWSLGVVAEVGIFMCLHKLIARFSLYHLMLAALALTVIRWAMIALFAEDLWLLLFAQCLHAASFAVCHAVAIEVVKRLFPKEATGQAQAFYSAISFGAGGALGALFSGYFWDEGATVLFLVASASMLLALALFVFNAKACDYEITSSSQAGS